MAKISKNIKALRKDKGLTQDALAENLNVTRQAISNWENDKSQPDIEMLKTIAQVFDVEIEEVIYGEKRNVGVDENKARQKNTLRLLLSIFGSLFIGVGLVLLFYTYWQEFPLGIKTAFSLLPLIIGMAVALFVFLRRQDSIHWREGAAAFWVVGVIATIALINEIFNIHCGYENCILIDAMMCLPIIYLLNAVSPLAIYFYMSLHWGIYKVFIGYDGYGDYKPNILYLLALAVLLILGIVYVYLNRREEVKASQKYSIWLSVIAAAVFVGIFSISFNLNISMLFALFIFFYAMADPDSDYTAPFKTIGAVGIAFFLSITSVLSLNINISNTFTIEPSPYPWVAAIICLAIVFGGFIFNIRKYKFNLYSILILSVSAVGLILCCVQALFSINTVFLLMIVAVTVGVIYIIKGITELKLAPINLGLIIIFVKIVELMNELEAGTLLLGILFLIFGGVMIAINKLMSDKKRITVGNAKTEGLK